MSASVKAYDELITRLKKAALLRSCSAILEWDEQTYLPPAGAGHRADQLALMAGMVHQEATSPEIGDLLQELESVSEWEADSIEQANIRETRHEYDRMTKLPRRLVEELSRVATLSHHAWVKARQENQFKDFLPWLEQMIDLKREQAAALGFQGQKAYDALLDEYEPGATSEMIEQAFSPLRNELVKLVAAIHDSGISPDVSILTRKYPVEKQREFSISAAEKIGFDFHSGRLDIAAHPFCTGIGPGDCRLTTRYDEQHFPGAFFGTLHEAGHGIYEQGLLKEYFGTPVGSSTSLGIHESQSRMWENLVGRSRSFWDCFYQSAQAQFPEALTNVSQEDFYRAINDVRPSYIRVEADEVTYNLHIMLRFELEQALIAGDLQPTDLETAWNEKFTEYFGITPDTPAHGCLQDVHWSAGLIGYFPTYALGNMYAAHFFNAANRELGGLDELISRGEFVPLKEWLNQKIHQQGKRYRANRLLEVVTGESLSHEPLVAQLSRKYSELYNL
ncbi:Thermostable carboxypeptidase 1 [Gimesia panareensis]|uniref:Metal-dependent carboxypeptidase n=1 Tax=Gimesia panareensis TaxID=2527978 RepID=A0A518FYP9_9PLAN|nr:carboxypeptidase M32 [Gimesia panareensis]QDV21384.1 Thermostable carboxypeptidase 1 [Gimesia panareensis]